MKGGSIDYMLGRQKAAWCQSPQQSVTVLVRSHWAQDTVNGPGFPLPGGTTPKFCPVSPGPKGPSQMGCIMLFSSSWFLVPVALQEL